MSLLKIEIKNSLPCEQDTNISDVNMKQHILCLITRIKKVCSCKSNYIFNLKLKKLTGATRNLFSYANFGYVSAQYHFTLRQRLPWGFHVCWHF